MVVEAEIPHYHPCGHCKRRPTGFPCFSLSDDLLKHEGIFQTCQRCDDLLEETAPDDGRESIAPGDYPRTYP